MGPHRRTEVDLYCLGAKNAVAYPNAPNKVTSQSEVLSFYLMGLVAKPLASVLSVLNPKPKY